MLESVEKASALIAYVHWHTVPAQENNQSCVSCVLYYGGVLRVFGERLLDVITANHLASFRASSPLPSLPQKLKCSETEMTRIDLWCGYLVTNPNAVLGFKLSPSDNSRIIMTYDSCTT